MTSSGTAAVPPPGTTVTVYDTFHSRNEFNGGEIGFATQWHRSRWSLDTLLKLGIGQTCTQVIINGGSQVFAKRHQPLPMPAACSAPPSNMGTFSSQQFSVMPELGCTLGDDVTSRLKATVGYTLRYLEQTWPGPAIRST